MKKKLIRAARQYMKEIQRRRNWRKVVLAMACVVVFCTTYALILPAITLEKNSCGLEEHSHGESCYEKVLSKTVQTLACGYDSEDAHVHAAECFDAEGNPTCGKTEESVHIHDEEACYVTEEVPADDADLLTCPLSEGHVHAENCCDEAGILICEETENHIHGDMCYGTWVLVCGQEEHTHTEECKAEEETEPNTLRYRGGDYEVTVRYEDSAGIPENAQLIAEEITGDAYQAYLQQTYEAMGYRSDDLALDPAEWGEDETVELQNSAALPSPLEFARFFDLTILVDGQKFELAEAVEVTVRYDVSVGIPLGEKLAVQFSQDGEVEIQSAEKGTPMVGARRQNGNSEEETLHPETSSEEFVFLQDSLRVMGTTVKNADPIADDSSWVALTSEGATEKRVSLGGTIKDNWSCAVGVEKTLTVYVNYGSNQLGNKKIIIQVPTGYQILAYECAGVTGNDTNVDDRPLGGVKKEPFQEGFLGNVDETRLLPAAKPTSIVGVADVSNWEDQILEGYDQKWNWNTELTASNPNGWTTNQPRIVNDKIRNNYVPRTYGGVIEHDVESTAQSMKVALSLQINQYLLSHTQSTEAMDPITVIVEYTAENGYKITETSYVQVDATGIPVVNMERNGSGDNDGSMIMTSLKNNEMPGRSGSIPIEVRFSNQLNTELYGSYVDKARITLTYPAGTFLTYSGKNSDGKICRTVYCSWFGYNKEYPIDVELINYADPDIKDIEELNEKGTEVVPGHLYVKWIEGENGGGTITWNIEKTFVHQKELGVGAIGAIFTANTNKDMEPWFDAGAEYSLIEGFEVSMDHFERNGKTLTDAVTFSAQIQSDNLKHVHLIPVDYVRRDITVDFQTDLFNYALGGIDVNAEHAPAGKGYEDCVFLFENVDDLKITALNLMGTNIKDVTVATNHRIVSWKDYHNGDPVFTTSKDISRPTQLTDAKGTLLDLETYMKDCGQDPPFVEEYKDEYIKYCMFTTTLGNKIYYSKDTVGSFVYFGQFQDGDHDGSREGDVCLRMLSDGTEHGQYIDKYMAGNNLDSLCYRNCEAVNCGNYGSNCPYNRQIVKATQHTTIGWQTTNARTVTYAHHIEGGTGTGPYRSGETIVISSSIWGGYAMEGFYHTANGSTSQTFINQSVLIDPELIISLPEGMTLDPASVEATSAKGLYPNEVIRLEQVGEPATHIASMSIKNADNTVTTVQRTWTTYRFRVPDNKQLGLVSLERAVGSKDDPDSLPITATFKVRVEANCPYSTPNFKDIIKWDINHPGYKYSGDMATDMSEKRAVIADKKETDAHINHDTYNFGGYGASYTHATPPGNVTMTVWENQGLIVDIGIKAIREFGDPKNDDGYITYNGDNSTIVNVIPGRYADVRVHYTARTDNVYHEGSAIYVPIPRVDNNYTMYFQNINLTNPNAYTDNRLFQYTMQLTGPVEMVSDDGTTTWKTYYARAPLLSNENPHELSWEPVLTKSPGGDIVSPRWASQAEAEAEFSQADWANVCMIKFVASNSINKQSTGSAKMRLRILDVDDGQGSAENGAVNYWRGYSKYVTDQNTGAGDWMYTSVVAATPVCETLEGCFFLDQNKNGKHDGGDYPYPYRGYTVEVKRSGDNFSIVAPLNMDGSFRLTNEDGQTRYLPSGDYTVTIRRRGDNGFYFANTNFRGPIHGSTIEDSIGNESPAGTWYNNVAATNDTVATWHFIVTNQSEVVHRVGIALKSQADLVLEGRKTLVGDVLEEGRFAFVLYESVDGVKREIETVKNWANGRFEFSKITFDTPGTYTFIIEEDDDPTETTVNYDTHTAVVTVVIDTWSSDGRLRIRDVKYENAGAPNPDDAVIKTMAAFTNTIAYELPETGGMGTTMFYVFGGIMMLAAFALLVTKKRMADAV